MSECLLITRGGWGDVWLVESREFAHTHPLWFPDAALVEHPHHILEQYNLLELPRLFRWVGGEDFERLARVILGDASLRQSQKMARMEQYAEGLMDRLRGMARQIPTDPDEIVTQVRKDRAYTEERKEETMTDTKADTKAKTGAAPKEPKTPRAKSFPLNGVIHFGVKDKETGTKYDAKDNNPKRVNSASRERFAFYEEGMTVEQYAKKVGSEAAAMQDLKWDTSKGFVEVETFD